MCIIVYFIALNHTEYLGLLMPGVDFMNDEECALGKLRQRLILIDKS